MSDEADVLSIGHFMTPFHIVPWLTLLFCATSVIVTVTLIAKILSPQPPNFIELISRTLLSILGEMLENVQPLWRSIEMYVSLRIMLLFWSFGALLLGQYYRGTITSTTVVVSDQPKLTTFEDVMVRNLSVYSPIDRAMLQLVEPYLKANSSYSRLNWTLFPLLQFIRSVRYLQRLSTQRDDVEPPPRKMLELAEYIWKTRVIKININDSNYIPRESILNCKNSVFVGTPETMEKLLYIHPDTKRPHKMYEGKEKILPAFKAVVLKGIYSEVMVLRLKSAIHSGIVDQIIKHLEEISTKKLKRAFLEHNDERDLKGSPGGLGEDEGFHTMQSPMMQIFLICGVILMGASMVFVGELLYSRLQYLHRWLENRLSWKIWKRRCGVVAYYE
jgi:hypothetical protein